MIFLFKLFVLFRAFDTLAKVLHTSDGSEGESLETTMQLMSADHSGSVLELDAPLLSDGHIPFKVILINLITVLPKYTLFYTDTVIMVYLCAKIISVFFDSS